MSGKGANDGPVFFGLARGESCAVGILHTPFGIHVNTVFFRIGRTWQDHISAMSTLVTMMPLIDNKRIAKTIHFNFVSPKQPDKIKLVIFGCFIHAINIKTTFGGDKVHIKTTNTSCRIMQNVEAVPVLCNNAVCFGNLASCGQNCGAIITAKRAHTHDNHRPLCALQHICKFVRTIEDSRQNRRIISKVLGIIGQVYIIPNNTNRHICG